MRKDQQHMDRLRAVRGLPPLKSRDQLFEEVAAARTFIDGQWHNRPDLDFMAFMSIFHPGHRLTNSPEGAAVAREIKGDQR